MVSLKDYPRNMADEEMKKVKFSEKGSGKSKGSKDVPYVIIYHPFFNCLGRVIKII